MCGDKCSTMFYQTETMANPEKNKQVGTAQAEGGDKKEDQNELQGEGKIFTEYQTVSHWKDANALDSKA